MSNDTKRHVTGWVLDVYIQGNQAVLWVKTETGETLRLTDRYTPSFYVKPKGDGSPTIEELAQLLLTHPNIASVEEERKRISLSLGKTDVLHIRVDSLYNYKKVLSDLGKVDGIGSYYNLDLLHVQRYLFKKGFPATCKAEITSSQSNQLSSLTVLDDSGEVQPPPFKPLIFDIQVSTEKLTPDVGNDPVSEIIIIDENERQVQTFIGEERQVFAAFQEHLRRVDPDFLVSEGVEEKLTYVLERARKTGFNLQLGRENIDIFRLKRLLPYSNKGRVPICLQTFLTIGIAGVAERARFAYVPPGLAARWAAGRIIDSGQCYEALRKDVLIPQSRSFFRYVKTAKEAIFADRGGLILSPKAGLHHNVAALDFESMYPHIIVKYNVSYETATPDHINSETEGLLPTLTEKVLGRRLYYKHLRKKYPDGSLEHQWCDQRQTALKGILVVIYGYSGCFANRFSNVACYEQINRLARENLVKALNIALEEGYEVIYADSDSLFVKKEDAERKDYSCLAKLVSEELGLPMALDNHFKFLALLTQEADPNLEAARRYFGKLTNGELYYRGIELRRHDTPPFLKEFETRLMETLFNADSTEKVWQTQYKKARDYVVETCDKVYEGKIPFEKLVISKVLRKPVNTYSSLFPHVVAAIQMAQKGKKLKSGEKIEYVHVNADHKNPFRRVVPAEIMDTDRQYYDRDKYVELVLDAAETVLGPFSFKRENLGFAHKNGNFLEELKLERTREMLAELETLFQKG